MSLIISKNQENIIPQDHHPEIRVELNDYISRVNHAIDRAFSLANVKPEYSELKIRKIENIDDEIEEQNEIIDDFDTLFSDLGVKVYEDDLDGDKLEGPLPINGIKKSDYQIAREIFNKIVNNESWLTIHPDASPAFRQAVLADVLLLMSRPTGRELLFKINNFNENLTIRETSSFGGFNSKTRTISILPHEMIGSLAQTSTGESLIAPVPRFMVLGHELIHVLHYFDFGADNSLQMLKIPSPLGKAFTNLEEQFTITGHGNKDLPYSSINENAMRAEYGLPSRPRHNTKVYDSELFFDQEELKLGRAIKDGAALNIINFFKTNDSIDIKKMRPLILFDVIQSEKLNNKEKENLIELLISKGAPVLIKRNSYTLLHSAVINKCNGKIFQRLLDAGIPPNTKDDERETALQLAQMFENKEAINILSKQPKPGCVIS